jgi:hypothetical protein
VEASGVKEGSRVVLRGGGREGKREKRYIVL